MEVGLQGGLGYCISGEKYPHPFMHNTETWGAQFRYKFDRRWALQLKEQGMFRTQPAKDKVVLDTAVISIDLTAEYNFYRFGIDEHNIFVKRLSPYIFLGIGVTMVPDDDFLVAIYSPVGVGLKWNFAERWQLQAAWQHQIYWSKTGDLLDGEANYNKPELTIKNNIFNNDLVSTITVGIVYEFAVVKDGCVVCRQ